MATISRREFFFGVSSFLVACGARSTSARGDAGVRAVPTPYVPDDDAPPVAQKPKHCGPATADNIEGPFYKAGAPSRAVLVNGRDRGERLVITGTVASTSCAPIERAELDVWHADAAGGYDNEGYHFRGTMLTDANGRFELRTIVPGRYLNGPRYRPAHVHVKLRAKGHDELTTQLYFEGDPYNESDGFIVDSLIMKHRVENKVRRAAFDFVLA